MNPEGVIALFVAAVAIQTGTTFPLLIYILKSTRDIHTRLVKLETKAKSAK